MDYVDDYLFDGIRVLLGEDGTVIQEDGKPVLQYVWGKYWVNNHAHILKSKSDYSIEAVYIALSRTAINHIVTGAVQKKISQKNLNSLKLEMPEPDSLRYLEDVFTLYRSNTEESRELERLRDALLPKLMSGEIDVSQIDLTQLNNRLTRHLDWPIAALAGPARSSSWQNVSTAPTKGRPMETVIHTVIAQMQPILSCDQLKQLSEVLSHALAPESETRSEGMNLLSLFLTAKEVEGCSPKTIAYYESTIRHMNRAIGKPYTTIGSDDLRRYLADYEITRKASKVTIDNIRRILSSFFSWLEDEDYIVKSPVRRIRRVKTAVIAKEVLTDEELEALRDFCTSPRDLALVDMLASTGMRVGELVRLNIEDVDLQERECIVTGKGNKQRPVYFDARTKRHLQLYIESRQDTNPALFVSLRGETPERISICGVEHRVRTLGKRAGIRRVHPHKFRRTLATHAIDKGMPIEQVQRLLGHAKIDTTMHYAMVNQSNVKASHRRYLE